jgi:hypothetical protein
MRLRDSFWALLHKESTTVDLVVVERIRLAMLLALDAPGVQEQMALEMCIRFAVDIGELWYLRADLQRVLSQDCTETQTLQLMQNITQLFENHYPRPRRFNPGASA